MCLSIKQWRSQLDKWGGDYIHIFLFTDLKKQSISKEINNAEHEHINMSPPPPIIELATPLVSSSLDILHHL